MRRTIESALDLGCGPGFSTLDLADAPAPASRQHLRALEADLDAIATGSGDDVVSWPCGRSWSRPTIDRDSARGMIVGRARGCGTNGSRRARRRRRTAHLLGDVGGAERHARSVPPR